MGSSNVRQSIAVLETVQAWPPCARRAQSTPAEFKIGQIVRRLTHAAPGSSTAVGLHIWLQAPVQRPPGGNGRHAEDRTIRGSGS